MAPFSIGNQLLRLKSSFGGNNLCYILKPNLDYTLPKSVTFDCAHLNHAGSIEIESLKIILCTSKVERSQQTPLFQYLKLIRFKQCREEIYDSKTVLKPPPPRGLPPISCNMTLPFGSYALTYVWGIHFYLYR